jgi:signal transduction histidine kinase
MIEWDLFISHATEDKDAFVRPLAQELQIAGFRVWFDEFSLTLGDSLTQSIDLGLAHSQFGLVVLSHQFFRKEWTKRELDGLVAREVSEGKVILPLWHGVTRDDVAQFSPTLADRIALDTAPGPKVVAKRIIQVLQPVPERTLRIAEHALSSLRHEIVAPIDGIVSNVEYIARRLPDHPDLDRIHLKLKDIYESAILIDTLVKTMPPIPDDVVLRIVPVRVRETLNICIGFVLRQARQHDVRVDAHDTEMPPLLLDRVLIMRVFYNILRNAIKYSDPTEPSRYIRLYQEETAEHYLLCFEDNGIGIETGEEEIIFQQFARGSNARRVSPDGSGMGLAYCRTILKQLGARISLRRKYTHKPTVFEVAFPKRLAEGPHADTVHR